MATVPGESKRTRVQPIFGWLRENAERDWPARLLRRAEGLEVKLDPGPAITVALEKELRVPPSAARLAWMIRNADRLAPREGRRWHEYRGRVIENPAREEALERLDRGDTKNIDRQLVLEGPTFADCLIECEKAVIWIEGKRDDWLDYSTTWDVTRDQLARDAEAAWIYAQSRGTDFVVLICHEGRLKHHEALLLGGYRSGAWSGGWPHLSGAERQILGARIGTVRWHAIAEEWPPVRKLADSLDR